MLTEGKLLLALFPRIKGTVSNFVATHYFHIGSVHVCPKYMSHYVVRTLLRVLQGYTNQNAEAILHTMIGGTCSSNGDSRVANRRREIVRGMHNAL